MHTVQKGCKNRMSFFSRFGMWLQRVMYGRYGSDALSFAILILYMILYILAQIFWWPILAWLSLLLLFWSFFRMFSKNIYARRRENEKFLAFWRMLKNFFTGKAFRSRDKEHKYYKCPKCKNTLRVPRRGKKIQITCPVCGNSFIKKA